MFPCSFCESLHPTSIEFTTHVKLWHGTHFRETCYCKYENCLRSFNNFYAYKKHLRYIHIDTPKDDIRIPCETNFDIEEYLPNDTSKNCKQSGLPKITSITNSDPISLEKFAEIVQNGTATLIGKLYSMEKLPRSSVHDLLHHVHEFYTPTCIEILKQTYIAIGQSHMDHLIEMLKLVQVAFDNFQSEHMCLKFFESTGCFIKPQSIIIDSSLSSRRSYGRKTNQTIQTTIGVILICTVLSKFLELPQVYDRIMSHIDHCKKSTRIISPIRGEL
ncbi:hypothetical protein PV327_010986 [Microctonus hyperodae]|uniref:C2H2-type domain-containing protein n=1 Tax=Microctonus hyperodae TaxID=165561 RepID=A0AA39EXU2_MICHY|nr:hypothetical protein PV327_010986 [Microctonus hyperodae]